MAALEFAGGRVHQPVLLRLAVDGLGVEHHDAHLPRLEVAAFLQSRDQLLVAEVPVAEIPPDGGAGDPLTVGQDVVVLVVTGHRAVRQA